MKNHNDNLVPDVNLANLENAYKALEDSVSLKQLSELERDGMIQRFEFVFELLWKSLKKALQKEGIMANSPKSAISEAFQAQWLSDEDLWLAMLKDRNSTTHMYDRKMAEKISQKIRNYAPEIRKVIGLLKKKSQET